MPKQLTGRVLLILAVLFSCLYILFPFAFKGSFKPNIRPGIDMVGGSSLLYELKFPEGTSPSAEVLEKTIAALRERVDPEGVKNLVWRASGNDKIEIQLPATDESLEAKPKRQAFAAAEKVLDAANVRPLQVRSILRQDPAQREQLLNALANGSPRRATLFQKILAAQTTLEQARAAQNAAGEADARVQIEQLITQIAPLNVEVGDVESALKLSSESERQARLDQLRSRDPNNTTLQTAINGYVTAAQEFDKVRNAVGDTAELKNLLRGSGVLSFHIAVKPGDASIEDITRMRERLLKDGPRIRPGDEMAWMVNDRPGEVGGHTVSARYDGKEYVLVWMRSDKSLRNREGAPKWVMKEAKKSMQPDGTVAIAFTFDPTGALLFSDLTGRHTPQSPGGPFDLAAVLDGKVISNASINSQIGAQGIISGGRGGFTPAAQDYLEKTMSAGALPAQLADEPLVERTVGPQLGADNLRAGFLACIFGVLVVAFFLVAYYYLSGVVAMIAVLLNILLILAGMSALQATFTLPSVAGIILTIGMAVDSNVLIFERLREEQQRGLSLRVAMINAYDRAFSAILDSNVTAAITGVILFLIGTEDVKGFGLTLLLGIIASLFTSLFVTKTIFAFLIDRLHIERLGSIPLTLPWWDAMLRPKIDWMGKRYLFIAGSSLFVLVGVSLFVWKFKAGEVLDIEFAGGTIVQFNVQQPMAQDEVRELIEAKAQTAKGSLDAPNVQSVGDAVRLADGGSGFKTYEVITVSTDPTKVRQALGEALAGKLDVAQAATFDGAGKPAADVRGTSIIPIESDNQEIAGFVPSKLAEHVGGVAVVVRNITPRLEVADIVARLDQQRLAAGASFKKFSVEPLPDGTGVIVLASDSQFLYSVNDATAVQDWTSNVANPTWQRVNDAIGKPAEFSRVSSINQTIAGETSTNAIIALIVSVTLIVIYVWVRFGDLKYGSATVVALVHDVLVVLGAIGVAHLLASSPLGPWLLLEPFRMNLTLVSAILTIIGSSMSDTVVVFDRIRENREKIGHVDRQVVNDSINQTLSRTLLTGATTIVTLLVMYITGGPAIHGFTFVMVVGLVTGTYSSIAIASPLLLLGGRQEMATVPIAKPAST
jgi:SecD/SecF fusion protein